MKQVYLIEKASDYINNKLSGMASESSLITMISRNESRKRTASNLSAKIDKNMRRLDNNNVISVNDNERMLS